MGQDFGVGIGRKITVAISDQLIFERLIIFDDAVMDERQFSAGVEMRVRILIGGFAVRGPTSVADTVGAGRRLVRHELSERRDPAGALPRVYAVAIHNRHARGVVAAIFQTAQTIEQNGRRFRTPDVTDNAAHDRGA